MKFNNLKIFFFRQKTLMPSRDLMKIKIDHSSSSIWLILEGIAVGFIVFGIIYGFGPLNVTNDKWIMSGYDEHDINQHYAGWVAFRNSAWHFPIGLADGMGGELISHLLTAFHGLPFSSS